MVVVALAAATEASSSYLLFRHYAGRELSFRPEGSAAAQLARLIYRRRTHFVEPIVVVSDRGPVFGPDPLLGFNLIPGRYVITERTGHALHTFRLGVDAEHRRVTAYEPVQAARRLYVTGDSSLFGWGLNDEETLPWLLQTRLPQFEVVNLAVNRFSTVHALLQLRLLQMRPDDIVVLPYNNWTIPFNAMAPKVQEWLLTGYEHQLTTPNDINSMFVPYGTLDASARLSIQRFEFACALPQPARECPHPQASDTQATRISELAFDQILSSTTARLVVAVIGGRDDDPVISHLRARGVNLVDLRMLPGTADADDLIPVDSHGGAFWTHNLFVGLLAALRRDHLIDDVSSPVRLSQSTK